jgi:hypothetical protein
MPTFNSDNITFIHIPKTAGVSINRYLRLQNEITYISNAHAFSSEIENPAPITFTVVRNPWDRVVSMYVFIKLHIPQIIFIQLYTPVLIPKDFNDFVLNIMKISNFGGKKISTPQVRWIEPGVTHLLRFENLEKDFKTIQDIFQCYEPLGMLNKIEHDHYRTYYNDETQQVIAEMFKEDIEAFGYEF